MDCFGCSKKTNYKNHQYEKSLITLTSKVRLLEDEMRGIVKKREEESKGYEKDMMLYAFKEAEWKQERKRLKEEVKRLRKVVEEKEERLRELEVVSVRDEEMFVVERENWRDEAVDKWKKLYLAIKTELDDLLQRTHAHGEASYWRIEEDRRIEELKMEVKAKEEAIDELKARLRRAEQEDQRKRREIDILRQSFRIMSTKKKSSSSCFIKPRLSSSLQKQAKKLT